MEVHLEPAGENQNAPAVVESGQPLRTAFYWHSKMMAS
jgi:hypothetical protein